MAAWSTLSDDKLQLLVYSVACGYQNGTPGGWIGGVPPLHHTQLSRQHCPDGCRCMGVGDVHIQLRMWSCVTCTQFSQ